MSIPRKFVTGKVKIFRLNDDTGEYDNQVLPELPENPTEEQLAATVRASLQHLNDSEQAQLSGLLTGLTELENLPGRKILIGGNDENPAQFYEPQVDDRIYYEDTTGRNPRTTGIYYQKIQIGRFIGLNLDYVRLPCVLSKETFNGFD